MKEVRLSEDSKYEDIINFIRCCIRSETFENKRVYSKAIRVVLINLGFDHHWVEDNFRDILDSELKEFN